MMNYLFGNKFVKDASSTNMRIRAAYQAFIFTFKMLPSQMRIYYYKFYRAQLDARLKRLR